MFKKESRGIMMNQFISQMELERKRLERQIKHAEKILSLSPEGALSVRKRKSGNSYYRNTAVLKGSSKKKRQTNITSDTQLVKQLVEKKMQQKILARAQSNLSYLKQLISKYRSTAPDDVRAILSHPYQDFFSEQKNIYLQQSNHASYPKAAFNPRYHTHETDCGVFVRSKSEQIIMNSLTSYSEFVTHYEEEFLYKYSVEGVNRVFPDFTIILPNGKRILWEHLGRLDDPEYCYRTALKLCLYQRNGYVIGDNLILTMDDYNGNISSALVLQAIQHILSKV